MAGLLDLWFGEAFSYLREKAPARPMTNKEYRRLTRGRSEDRSDAAPAVAKDARPPDRIDEQRPQGAAGCRTLGRAVLESSPTRGGGMLLRRWIEHVRSQNWLAVALDLAVVVVGVFLGFQLTEWNAHRKDAGLARSYLERLIADVEAEIEAAEFGQTQLALKRESLERVSAALSVYERDGVFEGDSDMLLVSIVRSTMYSWPAGVVRSPTFDEMTSTGALALIEDPALRTLITNYYYQRELQAGRARERRTGYGDALYRSAPAKLMGADQLASDEEILAFVADLDADVVLDALHDRSLQPYLVAEMSFATFMDRESRANLAMTIAFKEALEAYLATGEVRSVSWRLPG